MNRSYDVTSARSKLAEILDEVEAGNVVEVARRGKKVAVVISTARYARLSGEKTAFGDAYDAFMKKYDPKSFGFEPGEFEATRNRSPGRTVKL